MNRLGRNCTRDSGLGNRRDPGFTTSLRPRTGDRVTGPRTRDRGRTSDRRPRTGRMDRSSVLNDLARRNGTTGVAPAFPVWKTGVLLLNYVPARPVFPPERSDGGPELRTPNPEPRTSPARPRAAPGATLARLSHSSSFRALHDGDGTAPLCSASSLRLFAISRREKRNPASLRARGCANSRSFSYFTSPRAIDMPCRHVASDFDPSFRIAKAGTWIRFFCLGPT